MYRLFGMIALLLVGMGCDKREEPEQPETATQLLTEKQWVLAGHGFDDNGNNILDAPENRIQNCEDDNSYLFRTGGTGSVYDNTKTCSTPVNNEFAWKLKNNDTELEIEFETLRIIRLTEQQMTLVPPIPGMTVKYLLQYRH